VALFFPPYVDANTGVVTSEDISYHRSLFFDPDLPGNATLLALQWLTDRSGNATSFVGYAQKDLALRDDDEKTGEDLALASTGLGNRTLTVTASMPELMTLRNVYHYVTTGGVFTRIRTANLNSSNADANGRFSLIGPSGAGLGSLVSVGASYGGGMKSSVSGAGVEDGFAGAWTTADSDSVTVSFPDQPVLPIAPLSGSQVNPNATYRWAGPDGAVYVSSFYLENEAGDVSIDVVTTDTTLQLDDLSAIGLSLDSYATGPADLYWELAALGGPAVPGSVDELASADNASKLAIFLDNGVWSIGSSGYMFFVTGGYFGSGG